jgi:hypothetical protein
VTRAALGRINERERAPFVFYLHPWELDAAQPRLPVGGLHLVRHYRNLDRTAHRFAALLRDFAFAPVEEVMASLLDASPYASVPMAAAAG